MHATHGKLKMRIRGYYGGFQLRRKNVNVFVRTQKRSKANENVYC